MILLLPLQRSGQRGQGLQGTVAQHLQPHRVRQLVEHEPNNGEAPVAVRSFQQHDVPECLRRPVEDRRVQEVLVLPTEGQQLLVEEAGVPHLLLRDGREGHVGLDVRAQPGPFRVPVPQDQLVVGDREDVLAQRLGDVGVL